jgi:hypothetical protein
MAQVNRRQAFTKLVAAAGIGALLTSATSEARAAEGDHHDAAASDLHAEWGLVKKTRGGEYTVTFHKPFAEVPSVQLTPLWDGTDVTVGHIETLTMVSKTAFKAISGNKAENYFVSWLAVGPKEKGLEHGEPGGAPPAIG